MQSSFGSQCFLEVRKLKLAGFDFKRIVSLWKKKGLYKLTEAPQGPQGSATSVMNAKKLKYFSNDLELQRKRFGIVAKPNPKHPQRTLSVQRLLSGLEGELRISLSKRFFSAYWEEGEDLEDISVIKRIVSQSKLLAEEQVEKVIESSKQILQKNTEEAVGHGAFGVPSFLVHNPKVGNVQKLFFGCDRLHFVRRACGEEEASQPRLFTSPPSSPQKISFFFDFSSPWTFLAATQIQRIASETNSVLELRPFLLGALFKKVGTDNVPMLSLPPLKRAYMSRGSFFAEIFISNFLILYFREKDLLDWAEYWKVPFKFNTHFPIRTVLPLRVLIASGNDEKLFSALFKCAWVEDEDISHSKILEKILKQNGFDSEKLLKLANQDSVKQILFQNTDEGFF